VIEIYFKLQMGFYPVAVSQRQYNTQIQISHKITPLKQQTNKMKRKQISSQSHTNSEEHITANEYNVEKEKK
jgi:hypothetical protein